MAGEAGRSLAGASATAPARSSPPRTPAQSANTASPASTRSTVPVIARGLPCARPAARTHPRDPADAHACRSGVTASTAASWLDGCVCVRMRLAALVESERLRRHADVGLGGPRRYAVDAHQRRELVRELAHDAERGVLAADVHDAAAVGIERGVGQRHDDRALLLTQLRDRGSSADDHRPARSGRRSPCRPAAHPAVGISTSSRNASPIPAFGDEDVELAERQSTVSAHRALVSLPAVVTSAYDASGPALASALRATPRCRASDEVRRRTRAPLLDVALRRPRGRCPEPPPVTSATSHPSCAHDALPQIRTECSGSSPVMTV